LLDPTVIDASTLTPRLTSAIYLPIGIEGQADSAGNGAVGTPYAISRIDEAVTRFGPNALLTTLISAILDRGAGPVVAVASAKGTLPDITARGAAWEVLAADENVRLRLTDSTVQDDIAGLADSAVDANVIYNKQVAIVGMPSGTAKADLISAAGAVATGSASRCVLVGPGVYDANGNLQSGNFTAACVAAEIAKNADPSNDLDLWTIPLLTGIETDTSGRPIFMRRVVGGVAVDDFEDLLQGGVSPLQPSRTGAGGVQTTHLRTTATDDGTWDNLYTRIIVDQIFLDVKAYVLNNNYLRLGNTAATRLRIKSGVEALLAERAAWIEPIVQPDGTTGYGVSVTASADDRQVTIGYQGTVVRGISTVQVAANLTIPV
jgi:hypothetical protein